MLQERIWPKVVWSNSLRRVTGVAHSERAASANVDKQQYRLTESLFK